MVKLPQCYEVNGIVNTNPHGALFDINLLNVAVSFLLFTNASFSGTDPGGLMNYSHDFYSDKLDVVYHMFYKF